MQPVATRTAPDRYPTGTCCWWDIAVLDQDRAVAFYQAVFGWTSVEMPAPEGSRYTIFRHDGRDVAAAYPLEETLRAQGVPPHWLTYVAVDRVEDAVEQAAALGGTVMVPRFEVEPHGRGAVLQDPTGAPFAVWEAGTTAGAAVLDQVGAVCWSELASRDAPRSAAFFTQLFGWTTEDRPVEGMEYAYFLRGETPAGGLLQMTKEWGDVPSHWMTYVQVADCEATAARVAEAGGTVCVAPTEIPGVGTMAVINDPDGAVFSVLQRL